MRYEYMVTEDLSLAGLNCYGLNGWELVSVCLNPVDGTTYYYFKRAKPQP